MTGAAAILIIWKIAAMMLVIGCPLAMVSGYNPPPKRKTKRRNAAAKQRPGTKKRVKVKSRKAKAWHVAPKLSEAQLLQDRIYINSRDYGSAAQPNRMPL